MNKKTPATQAQIVEAAAALRAELLKRIPDLIVAEGKHPNLIQMTSKCYFGLEIPLDEKRDGPYWDSKGTGELFVSLSKAPMANRRLFYRRKGGDWDYDGLAAFLTECVRAEEDRGFAMAVEHEAFKATDDLYQRLELSKSENGMIDLDFVPTDPKQFRIKFQRDLNEESILRLIATLRDHGFLS